MLVAALPTGLVVLVVLLVVVLVLVLVVVGFIRGLEKTLAVSGDPQVAIVSSLGMGRNLEYSSVAMRTGDLVAASVSGIQERYGCKYVSPELYLATDIGLGGIDEPNMGITIDVGHALAASETPAEAICLVASSPWSYYIHINDNNRKWDWDLIPGVINFWSYLEFILYLKELNYQGWFASDVAPFRLDAIEAFARTIETTERMVKLADRLDSKKLLGLMEQEKMIEILKYLEEEVWYKERGSNV